MDVKIATPTMTGGKLADTTLQTPSGWAVELHAYQGNRRLDTPRCLWGTDAGKAYAEYSLLLEGLLAAGI